MTPSQDVDIKKLRDRAARYVRLHDYEIGPLLVLAGPGTGKTYSLMETMKHQMASGLEPNDFLECTLTNAAADKFAEDVRKRLGIPDPDVCTLHSRAKAICHRHCAALGLPADFLILSEREHLEMADHDLAALLGASASHVSSLRNKHQAEAANAASPSNARFFSAYRTLQKFYGAVDWYDVIALARELLQDHDDVRETESARFQFLLVDEYQDLNEAEQQLLLLLLNGRDILLAVGDDDQSIYSGRYAAPRGIVSFQSRYPRATIVALPVTSRLPREILRAAYDLVERNSDRIKGRVRPCCMPSTDERANGGLSICVNCKSDKAEAEFIASALNMLKESLPQGQVLILCPNIPLGADLAARLTHDCPSISLSVELTDEKTPHDELLRLHAARLLANLKDNLSLRFILADVIGSEESCSSLVKGAIASNRPLWTWLAEEHVTDSATRTRLGAFCATVQKARNLPTIEARLDYLVSHTPQLASLSVTIPEATKSRADPHESDSEQSTFSVRLMSLHKSKGLDADFVFIPFMEDSVGMQPKSADEQRRLLFVAMTRAKVACILSWAWSRRGEARHKTKGGGGPLTGRKPSPFISQCGIPTAVCAPWHTPGPTEMALKKLTMCALHVAEYDRSHQ